VAVQCLTKTLFVEWKLWAEKPVLTWCHLVCHVTPHRSSCSYQL